MPNFTNTPKGPTHKISCGLCNHVFYSKLQTEAFAAFEDHLRHAHPEVTVTVEDVSIDAVTPDPPQ